MTFSGVVLSLDRANELMRHVLNRSDPGVLTADEQRSFDSMTANVAAHPGLAFGYAWDG